MQNLVTLKSILVALTKVMHALSSVITKWLNNFVSSIKVLVTWLRFLKPHTPASQDRLKTGSDC